MSKGPTKESLAEKTRIYIDAHPSVKDCVSKGLINYSSLARMIMKDLDLDNEEAVMIACRRYAGKLGVTTDHEMSILKILKDSGYDKWLSVEFEGMEDCVKAIEYDLANLKEILAQ